MGSRNEEQTPPHHQPLLSSLVVRPSTSDCGGAGGRGSDYEPGEVRHEPPPPQYTRPDRYAGAPALNVACKNLNLGEGMLVDALNDGNSPCNSQSLGYYKYSILHYLFLCVIRWFLIFAIHDLIPGYKVRGGSASPVRRRDADHRYSSEYGHSGGPQRSRGFGSARDPGRYRDNSPYGRGGRGAGRPFGRGLDGPRVGPGPFRVEGSRNNPNVRPREGDWFCPDPLCGNLNFARRDHCNNCNKFRDGPGGSPRRGYPGVPPPNSPPRRFPGPPIDPPHGRPLNGYRSPPRGWARDGPREFGAGLPPPRHEGRFPDHQMRRDWLDYSDNYRGRSKFDRPMPMDRGNRDRGRDSFFERKAFERRPPSPPSPPPPLPPYRGRWAHDARQRSRSPLRGGLPPKDYNRPMYMDRGRDDRRGMGRDRIGGAY